MATYRTAGGALAGPAASTPAARAALAYCRSRLGGSCTRGAIRRRPALLRLARADQEAAGRRPGATNESRATWRTRSDRIGFLLWRQRPSEAEAEYRTALAIRRSWPTTTPPSPTSAARLALTHNNLGLLLRNMGRPSEAEAEYRKGPGDPAEAGRRQPRRHRFPQTDWPAATSISASCCWRRASRRRRRPSTDGRWSSTQKLADDNPAVTDYRDRLALATSTSRLPAVADGQAVEAEAEYRKAAGDRTRSWPTTTPPSPIPYTQSGRATATSPGC